MLDRLLRLRAVFATAATPGHVLALRGLLAAALLVSGSAHAAADGSNDGLCSLIPGSKSCIDATPCKTDSAGNTVCLAGFSLPPGALSTTATCWKYSFQYACASKTVDTCSVLRANTNCTVQQQSCQDTDPTTGKCTEFQYSYQCMTSPAVTSKKTVCSSGLFDSQALPTPTVANNTFAKAAVMQEVLREAQVYSQKGKDIFGGVPETCRKGYAGIKNCCKASPGAKSNSMVASTAFGAGASVVKYLGAQAIDWASPYVFDAMYNNGIFSEALASAFSTGGETLGTSYAAGGFSAGAFGFTYSAAETPGLFGANTTLFGDSASGFVEFNPYVFAAYVVISIITQLASCDSSEQLLAMHRGASLSSYIRTDCTSSFLGGCVEHTDTYCSFNSVLARLINRQGRAQLGMSLADCHGFTVQELSTLDFSRMDLSEFVATMSQQALSGVPDSGQVGSAYQSILTGKNGGSAQTGTMATNSNALGGTVPATPPPANPNIPVYPPPKP